MKADLQKIAHKLHLPTTGNKAFIETSIRNHVEQHPEIQLETLEESENEVGDLGYLFIQGEYQACKIQEIRAQTFVVRVTRNEEQGQHEEGQDSASESESDDEQEANLLEIGMAQFQRRISKLDRISLTQANFNDVRTAIWLAKQPVKDWMPLDSSFRFHYERHSTLYLQMVHATEPMPHRLTPQQLLQCGWKKNNINQEISPTNFAFNFGSGSAGSY